MLNQEKNTFNRIRKCLICNQLATFPLILYPNDYVTRIKSKKRSEFSILKYFIKRTLFSAMFERHDKKRGTQNLQKLKHFFKTSVKFNGALKFVGSFINKWLLRLRNKRLNYLENIDQMMKFLSQTQDHPPNMQKDLKKILSCFKKKEQTNTKKIKFARFSTGSEAIPSRFLGVFSSDQDNERSFEWCFGVLMHAASEIQIDRVFERHRQNVFVFKAAWQRILKVLHQNIHIHQPRNFMIIQFLQRLVKTFHNPELKTYSYNGICSPLSDCNLHSIFVSLVFYYAVFNYRFSNLTHLSEEIESLQTLRQFSLKDQGHKKCDLSLENKIRSNCSLVNLKKSEKIDVHAEEFRINWERLVQLFEMIDRIKANAGFKSQRFGFVYKHFWGVIFGNFLKKDWSYFFGPSTWENTKNNQKNHTSMIQKSNNFSSIAPSYSNFLKCMITKNALNESLIIQTKVLRKNPNSLKLLQKPPIILRAKKIKKLKIEEDKKIQSSRLTKNKNLKRVDSSTFLLRKRVTSSFIQKKRNLSSLKGQTKSCSKLLNTQPTSQSFLVSMDSVKNHSKNSSNSAQNISKSELYTNDSGLKKDLELSDVIIPSTLTSIDFEFYRSKILESCEVATSHHVSAHNLLNKKCLCFDLLNYCFQKESGFGDFYKGNIGRGCSVQGPSCQLRTNVYRCYFCDFTFCNLCYSQSLSKSLSFNP